jgi:hypothetical protein
MDFVMRRPGNMNQMSSIDVLSGLDHVGLPEMLSDKAAAIAEWTTEDAV